MGVYYNVDTEIEIEVVDFVNAMDGHDENDCATCLCTQALVYGVMNDTEGFVETLTQEQAQEIINRINELHTSTQPLPEEPQQDQALTEMQNAVLRRTAEVLEALQLVIGMGTHSQDAMHLRNMIKTNQISLI
jgi:hypothetical protein